MADFTLRQLTDDYYIGQMPMVSYLFETPGSGSAGKIVVVEVPYADLEGER